MPLVKCQNCGKMISDRAEKCIFCGHSLNSNDLPQKSREAQVGNEIDWEIKRTRAVIPELKNRSTQYAQIPDTVLEVVLLSNQALAAFYGDSVTKKDYHRAYILFDYLLRERHLPLAAFYLGKYYEVGLCGIQD